MTRRAAGSLQGDLIARLTAVLPREQTALDKLRSYAADPVGFARDILGINLWSRQRQLIEAIRDNSRVACCSGQKTGKSTTIAVAALWRYASFPGSRTIITAVTDQQVNGVIWREIRRLAQRAKQRGFALPGIDDIHQIARSGLRDPDSFAEIYGFTSREIEAVSGTSGDLLYLVDEASGVPDFIFHGIKGNMMGGGKLVLISNPSRSEGEFYRAFTDASAGYVTFEISSEETPNCTGAEPAIPYLADPEFIASFEREWGRNSALFKVRVLGKFVVEQEGRAFDLEHIEAAVARWKRGSNEAATGQLVIGLDPAGASGEGDESVFTPRRGNRAFELIAKKGLNDAQHIWWLREIISKYRRPDDAHKPAIVIDCSGKIGADLFYAVKRTMGNEVVCKWCRPSDKAVRNPQSCETIRDELIVNLAARSRDDALELPPDKFLTGEMIAVAFTLSTKGRSVATPKKELRKTLGRSPDRLDSVCLAFWWRDAGVQMAGDAGYDGPPQPASLDDPYPEVDLEQGIYDGGIEPY